MIGSRAELGPRPISQVVRVPRKRVHWMYRGAALGLLAVHRDRHAGLQSGGHFQSLLDFRRSRIHQDKLHYIKRVQSFIGDESRKSL